MWKRKSVIQQAKEADALRSTSENLLGGINLIFSGEKENADLPCGGKQKDVRPDLSRIQTPFLPFSPPDVKDQSSVALVQKFHLWQKGLTTLREVPMTMNKGNENNIFL